MRYTYACPCNRCLALASARVDLNNANAASAYAKLYSDEQRKEEQIRGALKAFAVVRRLENEDCEGSAD